MKIELDVAGPDFYCPDCQRWLARAKPDGTFDLAGKSKVILVADRAEFEDMDVSLPTVMSEAVCLRRGCRFKRWIRVHL